MHRRNPDIVRRGRRLKTGHKGEGPVVYWMSRDQRVTDNWALLLAQQEAVIHKTGLLVVFSMQHEGSNINPAQSQFSSEGLTEVEHELQKLNIGWLVFQDSPDLWLPKFIHEIDAKIVVCDFDPLKPHRRLQKRLLEDLKTPFYEVDAHNIIPAWTSSNKKEYGAYTIRPKLKRLLDDHLTDIPSVQPHPHSLSSACLQMIEKMHSPPISPSTSEKNSIKPGSSQAMSAAISFIQAPLLDYEKQRNDPCLDGQSGLSPYLHFGQLSAQRLALLVREKQLSHEITEPFLEELIVRRELSDNFCLYENNYDNVNGFTEWAQKTLNLHKKDKREFIYSLEALETGNTHQMLWNCCQLDLVQSGKLHGFLRMYWAKKILQWTRDPETAISYAIYLNDRYSIDGHDPNGYAGIAWSIGGVHDRAWGERPVFGKIRYMNEAGCRRKFDVKKYIASVLDRKDNG